MHNIIPISPLSELKISYGFASTIVDSSCLVAFADEGICFLAFSKEPNESKALEELKNCWKKASFKEDTPGAEVLINQIFSPKSKQYNLLVHGSDFQIKVWKELMGVDYSTTISYEEMGKKMGGKNYTRAAASAIAKNDISYLIPCHRIVSKTGNMHKYRWGGSVKEKLIKWERDSIT